MLSNRQTGRQTDRHTHTHTDPTTVTLAAHARRGLKIAKINTCIFSKTAKNFYPLIIVALRYDVYNIACIII